MCSSENISGDVSSSVQGNSSTRFRRQKNLQCGLVKGRGYQQIFEVSVFKIFFSIMLTKLSSRTLPNWTDLKFSRAKQNNRGKLQRSHYEPSEEESPTQVQQRNIREAEMLTSNLGEGGISQQEILSDITILKELAILQESMEWFSSRISEFANDLRRPLNGLNTSGSSEYSSPVTIQDGTIKVLTNLALEFDELANTCLLVLHLEVRAIVFPKFVSFFQSFHYNYTIAGISA